MSSVGITITTDEVSPRLAKLIRLASNPKPVFRAMATALLSITMGNFSSVGQSYRPAPWPAKRDGKPSHLQKSGALSRSFHLGPDDASVSTPMIYASIHQFGGTIKGKPYLRFKWGPGPRNWATVEQVKIPARPFFPIDRAGNLTPAADARLSAAAKRVLTK